MKTIKTKVKLVKHKDGESRVVINPKYTIKDLLALRFISGSKNVSKQIDKIVYGI